MANTIDILIKIKQIGAEVIEQVRADLENLSKGIAALEAAPIRILGDELEVVSQTTKGIAGDVEKIKDAILDNVNEIVDSAKNRLLGLEDTAEHEIRAIEGFLSRAVGVVGGLTFFNVLGGLPAISRLLVGDVSLLTNGLQTSNNFVSSIVTQISTTLLGKFRELWSLAQNLASVSIFSWTYLKGTASLLAQMFSSTVTVVGVFPVILSQSFFLLKRIFGQASVINTPLGQASSLVTTINSTLTSTYFTIYKILVPLTSGVFMGLMFGWSGLLAAIPAFINSGINAILSGITYVKNHALAALGVGRSALWVMFYNVRAFFLEISPHLKSYVPIIQLIAKLLKEINPVITRMLHPFTGFFRNMFSFKSFKSLAFLKLVADIKNVIVFLKQLVNAISFLFGPSIWKYSQFINSPFAKLIELRPKILPIFQEIIASFKNVSAAVLALPSQIGRVVDALQKMQRAIPTKSFLFTMAQQKQVAIPKAQPIAAVQPQPAIPKVKIPIPKIEDVAKETQAFKNKIEKQIHELLDWESILARKKGTGAQFSRKTSIALRQLVQGVFSDKAFMSDLSPEHFQKAIVTFLSKTLKIPKGQIAPADVKNLTFIVGDLIGQAIQEAQKAGVTKGKDFGGMFFAAVTASLKGHPQLQAAVSKALQGIEASLLASVKKTKKSGQLMIDQLATGMKEEKAKAGDAGNQVAQEIAANFPQSLAKKNPLRRLIIMGSLIGSQLAAGIVSSQPLVAYAAFSIANSIASSFMSLVRRIADIGNSIVMAFQSIFSRIQPYITEIRNTLRDATRVGATPANVALIQQFELYGASAMEATTAISRLQRLLEGSASADEARRLASLGINLSEVRDSTEPVVALMSELSDVIATSAPGSREMNDALELLGTTVSGNLVLALRSGSEAFRTDFAEMMQNSAYLTDELHERLLSFERTWGLLTGFIRNTVAAALNEVLPSITSRLEALYDFLRSNAGRIVGVVLFVLRAAQNAGTFIFTLLRNLVSAPERVFGPFVDLLTATGRMIISIVNSVVTRFFESVQRIGRPLFRIISKVSQGIVDVLRELVPAVFAYLVSLAEQQFPSLFGSGGNFLTDLLVWIGNSILEIIATIGRWFVVITNRIGLFFATGFDTLIDYLQSKIDHFVARIVVFFTNALRVALEDHPALLNIAEFLFGEDILDQLENLADSTEEATDDFANQVSEAFNRLGAIARVSFDLPDVPNRRAATANLEESLRRAGEIARNAWQSLQGDLANLRQEGANALDNLVGEEALAEYRDRLSRFANEARTIMGQMPQDIQDAFNNMTEALSSGALRDAITQAEALFSRMAEAAERAATNVTEASGGFLSSIGGFFVGMSEHFAEVSGMLSSFGQAFNDLYEMSGQKLKEFFIAFKAMSLAQVIIDTAKGVMGALAAEPVGPWNVAQAAAIAAAGTVQAAKIAAEMFTGFITGGKVPGREAGYDSKLIAVDGGEFIIPSSSVRKIVGDYGAGFLENLRQGLIPDNFSSLIEMVRIKPVVPGFQEGGFNGIPALAPAAVGGREAQAQTPINIVNVPDPNMLQQFLMNSAGQRTLLNFMSNNASELRRIVGGR